MNETFVIPCDVSPLVEERGATGELIRYHNITIEKNAQKITFLKLINYYTERILISVKNGHKYTPLCAITLMAHPHTQNDTHRTVTIRMHDSLSAHTEDTLHMRVYVFQSSPHWRRYDITHIEFFGMEMKKHENENENGNEKTENSSFEHKKSELTTREDYLNHILSIGREISELARAL